MHCLGDLLNSLGALSCKSTTGHAPAHRGTAEAKPREWQGAEKISKFQQSFPPHETPQKQCFFLKFIKKNITFMGCFTIYEDVSPFMMIWLVVAGAWHLQNSAEGHGGPLLFGGGRDLRRACCGNDFL